MATTVQHQQAPRGAARLSDAASSDEDRPRAPRPTTEQVWNRVAKGSFAVLSHVTPEGEPRSSGVVYKTIGGRLYVAVAPGSWKARHIATNPRVAVTVPVRRGGLLSLVAPIPPATISFHGTATVHPAGSPAARSLAKVLGSLLPAERRTTACILEVVPEGMFLTYGQSVPLRKLRQPTAAQARIPVRQEASRR